MRSHPRDSLLKEIFRHSGKAVDRLLEHVDGCERCRRRAAQLAEQERVVRLHPRGEDYGPSFDRAFQAFQAWRATLDMERSEAPALLGRLLGLTPERQRLLLSNSRRFQTWGLLERVIARGKEETFTDPEHAEEILHLAVDISGRLPPSLYGAELIQDLRARSWGYIANARRARRELAGADEAFKEAFRHLRSGSEDPLEKAVLWNLEASLSRSQENFEKAFKLSRKAIEIFREIGDSHLLARAMVNLATIHSRLQKPDSSASVLYEATRLIDPAREPRLALCALHNLVDTLIDARRFMSAKRVFLQARPLYRQFPTPIMQIGYHFLQAKIAYGLRQPEAEQLLSYAVDLLYRIEWPGMLEWPEMGAALEEIQALKAY